MKIKVIVEYIGAWSSAVSQEYRILKIIGAPTTQVEFEPREAAMKTVRVGDIVTEKQAEELAKRVELTTVRKES